MIKFKKKLRRVVKNYDSKTLLVRNIGLKSHFRVCVSVFYRKNT
jgi:hypothetical protein